MNIVETFDLSIDPSDAEQIKLEFSEAAKTGKGRKKLTKTIAALHEGITRNRTEYHADELKGSIPSWTTPYPKPVIKDHGRPGIFSRDELVDDIIGRVEEAYMGKDMGVQTLMHKVSIMDTDAIEKILDGRYQTVSVGLSTKHAICSICGTDLAVQDECGHKRGQFYLVDEMDPKSAKMCTWILQGLSGGELSFVVNPSDTQAGVRNSAEDDLIAIDEGEFEVFHLEDVTSEDDEAILAIESEIRNGSSVSFPGVEIVPDEKEDMVAKKLGEVVETVELVEDDTSESTASEATEESMEEVTETEDEELVDGQESESEETDTESTEDTESTDEDPETESEQSEESSEDDEADESEHEPETETDESAEDRDELLVRLTDLTAENHQLKARLYVEMGLRDGILEGGSIDLEAMFVENSESTLDDLISSVADRRVSAGTSTSSLVMNAGVASPVRKTTDDKKANKDQKFTNSTRLNLKTPEGSHRITVENDDSEREPIKVTIKTNRK